ncbi:MAG: VRR-NUC domain-containing protein [Woeseia sp.]|nr:VRR-NUC domain-containing protein [Woeseia sp.]
MPDYLAAEAKRQKRQRAKPRLLESATQQALVQIAWLHRNHPRYEIIARMLWSSQNGANVEPHHRERLVREGMSIGYPDLGLDVARGGWHGMRVEMKAPKARTGKEHAERQERRRYWLHREGYYCVVCDDAERAWCLLCDYVDGRIVRQVGDNDAT